MTTRYSGNPANVSNSLSATITGVANNGAGLCRVTTSAAHLFASFDVVSIYDVTGATEANGTWSILVIDATHFDLVGSGFTSAYVSGGTAIDRSFTPAATLPSDGEPLTSSSVLAALQLLLDRTQAAATDPFTFLDYASIPPLPFNISYAADWIVGDDGTIGATGSRLVKAATNANALLVDITPFLTRSDGRNVSRIACTFAVGQAHANVPANLPSIGLYKTQSIVTTGVAPAADVSLLAAGQSVFPAPGSGAAYYASGHLQSWTIVPDQNKVIDVNSRYYIKLIDENGANSLAKNIYFGFQLYVS
jgi:hypothetical protein